MCAEQSETMAAAMYVGTPHPTEHVHANVHVKEHGCVTEQWKSEHVKKIEKCKKWKIEKCEQVKNMLNETNQMTNSA